MPSTTLLACRICGNTDLVEVCHLGTQALTGIFPKPGEPEPSSGPLRLLKCNGDEEDICGLLQLGDVYDLSELYGAHYGYRSGLNPSMVVHLREKVSRILAIAPLRDNDLVVDIGSNDGTTLAAYPAGTQTFVGVDPSGQKFEEFYPTHATLLPDFFSAALMEKHYPGRRARVITSFSMFYDLEQPLSFMKEVLDLLEDEGIWIFEQSYMPAMLKANAYDTVCHEHLEYYGLKQIKWMADRAHAKIVDVEFNDVNGGSFSVTLAKHDSPLPEFSALASLLERERAMGLDTTAPYLAFGDRTARLREELVAFLRQARREGKRVAGLGASTKGNVVLQYCGIDEELMESIGEVNQDKFGAHTPGSMIPIIPENTLLDSDPDYLVVLPWHFRRFFETSDRFVGSCLVFPLPNLSFVQR